MSNFVKRNGKQNRQRPDGDLARTLNAGGMTIAAAVVATYGVQAVDVFYVKDSAGMKLISESKLKALKKKLLTAIHEPEII